MKRGIFRGTQFLTSAYGLCIVTFFHRVQNRRKDEKLYSETPDKHDRSQVIRVNMKSCVDASMYS